MKNLIQIDRKSISKIIMHIVIIVSSLILVYYLISANLDHVANLESMNKSLTSHMKWEETRLRSIDSTLIELKDTIKWEELEQSQKGSTIVP